MLFGLICVGPDYTGSVLDRVGGRGQVGRNLLGQGVRGEDKMGGLEVSNVQGNYPLSLPLQQSMVPTQVSPGEHSVPPTGAERSLSSGHSSGEDRVRGGDSTGAQGVPQVSTGHHSVPLSPGEPQVSRGKHPVPLTLGENTVSSGEGSRSEEVQWTREEILQPQLENTGTYTQRNNAHRTSWHRRPVVSSYTHILFEMGLTHRISVF